MGPPRNLTKWAPAVVGVTCLVLIWYLGYSQPNTDVIRTGQEMSRSIGKLVGALNNIQPGDHDVQEPDFEATWTSNGITIHVTHYCNGTPPAECAAAFAEKVTAAKESFPPDN